MPSAVHLNAQKGWMQSKDQRAPSQLQLLFCLHFFFFFQLIEAAVASECVYEINDPFHLLALTFWSSTQFNNFPGSFKLCNPLMFLFVPSSSSFIYSSSDSRHTMFVHLLSIMTPAQKHSDTKSQFSGIHCDHNIKRAKGHHQLFRGLSKRWQILFWIIMQLEGEINNCALRLLEASLSSFNSSLVASSNFFFFVIIYVVPSRISGHAEKKAKYLCCVIVSLQFFIFCSSN